MVSKQGKNEGLSVAYRLGYRVRYLLLSLFGPAQQSGEADPQERLRHERAARVKAARQARLARGEDAR
jgi:hypothetical protein